MFESNQYLLSSARVLIGMIKESQLPISLLDLIIRRRLIHFQDLVEVNLHLQFHSIQTTSMSFFSSFYFLLASTILGLLLPFSLSLMN